MAQLVITIPNSILARVVDGFAGANNYSSTIPNPSGPLGSTLPNPESKVDFCKRKLLEFIKESVRSYEIRQASSTASMNASVSVDTDITLS